MLSFAHRLSIALNALLLVTVVGLGALLLWRSWETAQAIDARPRGAVVSLPRDVRIVSGEAPTINLPAGTILQESTPQGAATLGKISHREYILTIRTDDFQFTTNQPYQRSDQWITPYMFWASPKNK